jgi:predicted ATPase/DNA-binding SARP family transcriptional activator
MLAYFAVEQGVHSRDKIATLLWPESDEERGRASLRRTLAYLRDTLDETAHRRSGGLPLQLSHVLVDHDTLRFNTASDYELDTYTLQKAFTLARHRSSRDLHTHLAQLQVAASCYRGNFLDGLTLPDTPDFDDWLLLQRESCRRQANTVFEHLSQLQAEGGELENALDTTSHWITHDLLNETAHARLMQLHFALGDHAAALQAYEYCRFILERELGAEPAAELKALEARIRSQASPLREPIVYESPSSQMPWELPLTGRIAEHLALVTAFHIVQQGRMQVATIEGEPGIGKTRLAQEFLKWARAQGADVLGARAFETGSRLPYQPLIEAIRSRLEGEQSLEELLSDVWLSELARLLPELRELFPSLPPPLLLDEADARSRLFEAISRLGQALAKRAPVVIFIDDVQWADAASLDVLQYASRRWTTAHIPVFLLCTLRSEDLASSASLADWLSSLERDLPVKRQTLTSLTYEHTLRLVQSLFNADSRVTSSGSEEAAERNGNIETLGQWLFTETSGHPFFLVESLKALTERGELLHDVAGTVTIQPELLTQHDVAQLPLLPSSVRDLIHVRLTRLSHHALNICMAGAVLGDGFTFDQLCHVADIDESQALPALDELLTRGLLRETDERCFFTHDKIREQVYAETGKVRRRVFHRRALDILQASFSPPAQLAQHAFAAGLPEATVHLSIAAGDEAMRLFATSDAIAHYEQARRLVIESDAYMLKASKRRVALSLADLSQLYLQLGWAHELRGEFAQAKSIYEEMLAVAREMYEPVMECTSLNRLATLAAQSDHDLARADELLQQALNVAESSQNKAGVAETLWNLAQTGFYAGKMQASLPHAEQALVLARELQQQELIGRSLHALATLETVLGEWEKSLSNANEAYMLYTTLGNHVREVGCLCVIAQALTNMGQTQQGIDAARAALSMSVEIEDSWGQINAAVQMVPGLLDSGAYSEARSIIQQGISLARTLEVTPLLVISLNEWGNVCRAMLELDAAKAAHNEALTLCERFMPPHYVGWFAGELCADCALASQWQEASAYALQAAAARDISILHGGLARWHETAALLRGGSTEHAREMLRRFGEQVEDKRRYRIPYLQASAVLAQWENNIDQAIAHLEAARVLAEQLDLPGELWQILAFLGELYQSCENSSQSQSAFANAVQVVQSLAARIENEQQRKTFLSAQQVQALFAWITPAQ